MNIGSRIHVDSDGNIGGQAPWVANRSPTRPVKTYGKDRKCVCGARLSIYNEDNVCATCSGTRWAEH